MSFSACQITHTFSNADLTPASGSITFSLSGRMSNGTTTIVPAEITANLDSNGGLSRSLTSNVDAGTSPQSTTWIVSIRIQGAETETFSIVVPTGGGSADLRTLLPSSPLGG